MTFYYNMAGLAGSDKYQIYNMLSFMRKSYLHELPCSGTNSMIKVNFTCAKDVFGNIKHFVYDKLFQYIMLSICLHAICTIARQDFNSCSNLQLTSNTTFVITYIICQRTSRYITDAYLDSVFRFRFRLRTVIVIS